MIVVLIVAVPVMWFVNPVRANRKGNEWAQRRNAEGRGNFLTKPLWGKNRNQPQQPGPDQSTNRRT
ncbi:hypothetical protein [Allobranchiibius sp. CTAmp26]|uniref:hypothetical protein n=1 Tax=Allobranchiibius sp. CTAmp26 TaxID=2815214 RepID=UPI001AA0FDD9|nr:hypothetical protein [Allobranchiibius sp. CTAmp26]MBO1756939.1 hypothetical protein [Allobranchiibius sp. CTAmp26]